MSEPLVPLSHLQLEGLGTVEELARRFADVCLLDDLGRTCVDRRTAAAAIREHTARQARARDRQRQRRERLAEAGQSMRESLRGGIPAGASGNAFSDMMGADPDSQLARSGRALDEMLSNAGSAIYHPHHRSDP